jgi:RNA polymerase sigma-70 factor (ECF subfamily)
MARPLGENVNQLRLSAGAHETDERVRIVELQAGSDGAFDWLVATYSASVYRLAYRLLNKPEDASDVVQDVFLKIFRSVDHFHGHCALKTWIYHIAVNTVWNQNRWWRRHREQALEELEHPNGESGADEHLLTDETASPLAHAQTSEAQAIVWKALGRLNESHRMILVLREMEDLSYDEVAEILALSTGTVKSRLARARLALKHELEALLEPAAREVPEWHLAKVK